MRVSRIYFVSVPVVLSALFFTIGNCITYNLTSPCPRLFTYENNTEAEDRWYGAVTIQSDYDLSGVWLRIEFDRPVNHIRSSFGEVIQREGNEYLIKNRDFKLLGDIPYTVRFYVQFSHDETPASLIGFRLNGKLLCPEKIFTGETTAPLFTSLKTSELEGLEHSENSKVTVEGASETASSENGVLYISPVKGTSQASNTSVVIEKIVLPLKNDAAISSKNISKNNTINTLCATDNSTNEVEGTLPQEEETLSVGESPAMMQITEDTPPDMLAGAMDLTVHLPTGRIVKMAVERSTPMMDLLVQITTAHRLQHSGHILQALAIAPASGHTDKVLPYKPNTPIGTLDIQHLRVVTKNRPNSAKNASVGTQPFESTFRLQVHLPRNQLYVIRVSQHVYLGDIMKKVCEEKNLDMMKYEFRHPGNLDELLDPKLTLSDYQITEVYVVSKGTLGLAQAFSSNDIMALRKEEERKQLQARTGGGVFSLIFKRGKPSGGTGSLSSENCSISPSHSDDSRSITPPAVQQQILPSIPQEPLEKPKAPQRKRRLAPKPPQQVEEQRKESTDKPASQISNISDVSETDSQQRKSDSCLTICHSRNSSDSSGYHEPSVLSDHCNTSLPRRAKGTINEVVISEEIVPESKNKLNGSLSSMATFSKSTTSVASRKKKIAPPPPPPLVIKSENVAFLEKASPVVDASATFPEKQEIPRLPSRNRRSLEPPKPTPRLRRVETPISSDALLLHTENEANRSDGTLIEAYNMATVESSSTLINDFKNNGGDNYDVTSSPELVQEVHSGYSTINKEENCPNDPVELFIGSGCRDDVQQFAAQSQIKKWNSLNALEEDSSANGYSSAIVDNKNTAISSISQTNKLSNKGSASLPSIPPEDKETELKDRDSRLQTNNAYLLTQSNTLPNKLYGCSAFQDPTNDISLDTNAVDESFYVRAHSSPYETIATYKLENEISNVDTSGNNTLSFNSESAISYEQQDVPQCEFKQPVEMLINNIPNIPVEHIETDIEKDQSIDKTQADFVGLDWEYQIPPPPSEFRDSSPVDDHTLQENEDVIIAPPNVLNGTDSTISRDCDITKEDTKPMLNTLTLETLEKRKSLVYNREISTSLKIAQENNHNCNVVTDDIDSRLSNVLHELEEVIHNGSSKTLSTHVEEPIVDSYLPNFKISTYAEPKTKISIFEDESIRSTRGESIKTDDLIFKKPYEFNKCKTTSRNNFYVKHQNHNNLIRSESFSNNNMVNWKPQNPVQRSKSQLALNKPIECQETMGECNGLTKSSSLFDVSGLQSLEVMRVIQNKLNTPSNSVEQLLQDHTATSTNNSTTLKKEDISNNLPPKTTESESSTNTKTYQYQGPPAINLSTWSERPKTKVSLKEDTDYKISNTNNNVSIKINGSEHKLSREPGNVIIKIGEAHSNNKEDFLSRFQNYNSTVGYRKPFSNVNKIEKPIRPHSVAFDSEFDISRVPIVRAVELKKSVTQINNDNNGYTDIYRGSEMGNINQHKSAEIKPVQRVNSFAQHRPNVIGFRGIEIGNDNTARSRKSWNVPNSYSTLPSKINLVEPPDKSSNFMPNSNVPFSQLRLKRVESSRATNGFSNGVDNIALRNNSPQVISHNNNNRYSTGSQFGLRNSSQETQPVPPPMPKTTYSKTKNPIPCNRNSSDPRDELLNSIRNFGGLKGFRNVKV